MKVTIKIANVYDGILDEVRKELVIVRGRQSYVGKLFFKKEDWESVKKVHKKVVIDGSAQDIMLEAYELLREEGMLAKDDKSLLCMMHWQFVNGLTNEMICAYKFKNDTEFLNSLG